jgi:hypothetical protein
MTQASPDRVVKTIVSREDAKKISLIARKTFAPSREKFTYFRDSMAWTRVDSRETSH